MAVQLKIFQNGTLVNELSLAQDKSYIAGRKEGSDIYLQGSQGISREHFKISFDNGHWVLHTLSKFGEVIFSGEKIQERQLKHLDRWLVPPYEFELLEISATPSQVQNTAHNLDPSQINEQTFNDLNSKTVVGVLPHIPYIKIMDHAGEPKTMIRIEEGSSWLAGRDPICHIFIDDNRVSRKQFEIKKQDGLYYISDLGSVNGTYLNGTLLKSHEWILLKSGDGIAVLDNNLYFELHDPNFKSRIEQAKALPVYQPQVQENVSSAQTDMSPGATGFLMPHTSDYLGTQHSGAEQNFQQHQNNQQGSHHQNSSSTNRKGVDFKKNRPLLIGLTLAIVFIAYLFSEPEQDAKKSSSTKTSEHLDPISKLTPEQLALVKQSYQLAKNYYMQGRYESAKSEIAKMKEFIPQYLESENIERMADQAIYLLNEKAKNDKIEKERQEREEKIHRKVAECTKKINPFITVDKIEECLADVIQFDPNHPDIISLKAKAEQIVHDRTQKEIQNQQRQALVAQLKSLYSKAETVESDGNSIEAIAAYEKVSNSSLPDPMGLKKKSEKKIIKIKNEMSKKSASYLQEASEAYEKKNLKLAITLLRKAMKVNPTDHELQDRVDQYMSELKKQMMVYYQEGILEESFGNVEGGENKTGAKEKWKKIIELDVPDGEYYQKAAIKLKKYGAF